MALDKNAKDEQARKPSKHVGQSNDQVDDNDPNPPRDNLASKGDKVVSGRGLSEKTGDSAPKVNK